MLETAEYYEKCNLTTNPFQQNTVYENDERAGVWVGYEGEKRQIVRVLTQARLDRVGSTRFLMLLGSWGTGKTHALTWFKNYALSENAPEFNAIVYYISTLKHDAKFSFKTVFNMDIVTNSRLPLDVLEFKDWLRNTMSDYRAEHGISATTKERDILESLIGTAGLVDMAEDILKVDDLEAIKVKFLKVSSDYDAQIKFTNLMKLFVFEIKIRGQAVAFKKAVYLLLDEVDQLQGASVKDARIVNDLIREIYDSCPRGLGLVTALSAEISELPALFQDYVLSRIDRTVEMSILDRDDAVKFVEQLLGSARVDSDKKSHTGFFPFSEDCVLHIMSSLNEITPRKIMKVMFETLEIARTDGDFDPSKDGLLDEDKLEDYGINDDLLYDQGGY